MSSGWARDCGEVIPDQLAERMGEIIVLHRILERQCEAYLRDIDVCDGLNDQIRAEQKAMAARLLTKVRAAAVETRP